jgi:hypothetical protein
MNRALARIDPFSVTPFGALGPVSLFDGILGGIEPFLHSNKAALDRSLGRVGLQQFAVNVVETEKEYTLTAELPGVSKEHIKVDIDEVGEDERNGDSQHASIVTAAESTGGHSRESSCERACRTRRR